MPRNAAGQYTLPPGNPTIANTLIESDGWANPTMEDLGAEIEDSLSRDGKGSMRAALGIIDGSQANPGLRFIGETGSGLYRNSDGEWWLTVKGVGKIQITESAGIMLADAVTVNGDHTVNGTGTYNGQLQIIGQADIVQLIVTADAGQTENLTEWWTAGGDVLAYISEDGNMAIFGAAPNVDAQRLFMENAAAFSRFTKFTDETGGGFVDMDYDIINEIPDPGYSARWRFGCNSIADAGALELCQLDGSGTAAFSVFTSTVGDQTTMTIRRRSATQTAPLYQFTDETGQVLSAIDAAGNFVEGPGGGGQTPDNSGNVPVGALMHWPLAPPLVGVEWLVCDGSSHLVATFPDLWAYLGDAYGGDGGTNFNVPDYRGNFLRMQDQGAGVDPQAASRTNRGDGTTGDNPGTRQPEDVLATAIGAHTHLYLGVTGGPLSGGGGFAGQFIPTGPASAAGGGVETRPVNVYTVIAIKAV